MAINVRISSKSMSRTQVRDQVLFVFRQSVLICIAEQFAFCLPVVLSSLAIRSLSVCPTMHAVSAHDELANISICLALQDAYVASLECFYGLPILYQSVMIAYKV